MMQKQRYYGEAKKRIRDYQKSRQKPSAIQRVYDTCTEAAIQRTVAIKDGERRMQVVSYVLFKGKSYEAAAMKFNYSTSTVIRYVADFVNIVCEMANEKMA